MFKKLFKSLSLVLIVLVTATTLAGCGAKVTNFSTEGVTSNGNIGAVKDGYIYFVKRLTSDRTLTGADTKPMGIYKSKIDENGNLTGDDELVYSALAGYTDGEVYIFGDYIYFSTPAQVTSSTANKLVKRASFARVGLDGKNYKVLYTTETEGSPKYSYYKFGEDLYLVVYENKTIYSLNVKTGKVLTIAEEVQSAILSSSCGEGTGADTKIFYSLTPAENFVTQSGQNIYSVNPDGSDNILISAGADVTLKEVKNGYLYFVQDKDLYRTTAVAGLSKGEKIYYGVPDSYSILSNGTILVKDTTNSEFRSTGWINNKLETQRVLASTDYDFLFENNGYAYFKYTKSGSKSSEQVISRISLTETGAKLQKVTEEQAVKAGSFMNWEVIANTLYYFTEEVQTTEDGKSITYSVLKTVVLSN